MEDVAMGVQTEVRRPAKVAGSRPIFRRRMTEQEFVEWCDEDTRAEWVDGEVILMAPVSDDHDDLFAFLSRLFGVYVEERDLGRVLGSEFQIRLATQRTRRQPDILFVAKERLHLVKPNHLEGAPDLVLEIVSPESTARDWREKHAEYEAAGVREYWIVDPQAQRVEAYELSTRKKYRLIPEEHGAIRSKILRGLYLKPAWLWRSPRPKVLQVLRELGAL
jgi:Uma2 family endonuclease